MVSQKNVLLEVGSQSKFNVIDSWTFYQQLHLPKVGGRGSSNKNMNDAREVNRSNRLSFLNLTDYISKCLGM